jgi:RNA polymerase sigma factor (TIGR02999 family)
MSDVTRLIDAATAGDRKAAADLLPLVYDELRRLAANKMARETGGQTIEATALVHEAYLRLVDTPSPQGWSGRGHFFAAAAEAMRRILVERARQKKSLKAGGEFQRHDLVDIQPAVGDDLDLLALNDALDALERRDERQAAVVKLRFFAGLTVAEAAEALGVSVSTAENDWAYARAWLRLEMDAADDPP